MFAQQDLVSWTSAVITMVLSAPIAAVVGVVAVCAFLVAGAFKGHWAAVHVRDDSTP